MAKTIKDFPKQTASPGKYPWAEWMNGKVWIVCPADDICDSFRTMLYAQARKNGMRVKTRVKGDDVIFRFYYEKQERARLKKEALMLKRKNAARKLAV